MLIGAHPSSSFTTTASVMNAVNAARNASTTHTEASTSTASAVSAAKKKSALSRYGEQQNNSQEAQQLQQQMLNLARQGGAVRKTRRAGFSAGGFGVHYEESSLDVDTKQIDLEQTRAKAKAYDQQREVAGVRNMVAARAVSAYTQQATPNTPNSPAMRAKAQAAYTSVAKGTTSGYTSQVQSMISKTV